MRPPPWSRRRPPLGRSLGFVAGYPRFFDSGANLAGFLLRRAQLCQGDAAMAISNMMRDDVDTSELEPQVDPNSDAYWAERGMKRPQMVWERLSSSNNIEIYRTRVPGGWLLMVAQEYRDCGGSFFYPDPTHRWDGTGYHG
jgi:hypothetical protein